MSVPFYVPFLPDYKVVEPEIQSVYASGMLAPGIYTERLCRAVEEYLGVKHCVAFSNCSDAMMCIAAYMTDRYIKRAIIPDFTFASTWQACDWNNMEVSIRDVTEEGQLDLDQLEKHDPASHTCIIPVHMFGNPIDEERLSRLIAGKMFCEVFYDAAHAFGSLVNGKPLGSSGNTHVFSIGTTKPLAAGEGGLITTNNTELAQAMIMAAMHGHKVGELDVEVKSLNGRIQEFNSILAYHGLQRINENIEKRTSAAEYYNSRFPMSTGHEGLKIALVPVIKTRSNVQPSYKDYTICISASIHNTALPPLPFREFLVKYLENNGIGCKRYYYPSISGLQMVQDAISETKPKVFTGWRGEGTSKRLSESCISIPFFTDISRAQQDTVLSALRGALNSLYANSLT